jgi:hypothetical protein
VTFGQSVRWKLIDLTFSLLSQQPHARPLLDSYLLLLFSYRIIYPHSYAQFQKSGKTEEDLIDILKVVHLAYLPAREGGWETVKEWKDVLSGGEKQRVSLFNDSSPPL